jgi:uncharacterized protein YcfJ
MALASILERVMTPSLRIHSIWALRAAALAALGGLAVQAQATEYGRVISATPITQQVSVPQRVCQDQEVAVQTPNSGVGALIGAIAGGVLGHTVGAGGGRVLATGAGVVAGSIIGDHVESDAHPPTTQTVRSCGTAYTTQNRVVGYDVEYEYRGQRYTTQTRSAPGRRIALNVQVEPADSAPPVQQAPVEAAPPAYYATPVYAPAPVIYAPQPYYQPYYYYGYGAPVVVHLGYGWYGHRRWR